METIKTKQGFMTLLLEDKKYKDITVLKRLFSFPTNSKFTSIKDNNVYYQGKHITFANLKEPLLNTNDKITFDGIETTVGRLIINKLIHAETNGKIPYINKPFTLAYPVSLVKAGLGTTFTLEEYKGICRVSAFIRMLTPYIVVPATMKSISPIVGIDKEKERIAKELSKINPNWRDDDALVLRFEAESMKFVNKYYEDDATHGITFKGKTVGSIKKQFVSVGANSTPDPVGKAKTITTSLNDGLQLKHDDIAATNNSVRAGSAGRGIETRDGGVTFKVVVQACHSIKIIQKDCKTKGRELITVTKALVNGLRGLYYNDNQLLTLDKLNTMVGKTISVRMPTHCESKGSTRCKYCCGDELSLSENGITLMAIKLGSLGMLAALAKFHQSADKLVKVTPATIFAK